MFLKACVKTAPQTFLGASCLALAEMCFFKSLHKESTVDFPRCLLFCCTFLKACVKKAPQIFHGASLFSQCINFIEVFKPDLPVKFVTVDVVAYNEAFGVGNGGNAVIFVPSVGVRGAVVNVNFALIAFDCEGVDWREIFFARPTENNAAEAVLKFIAEAFEITVKIYRQIVGGKIAENIERMHTENAKRSFCLGIYFARCFGQQNGSVKQNHKVINSNDAAADRCERTQTKAHVCASVAEMAVYD